MKARVQKWGNSLALRIPRALAEETGLQKESPVELSLVDGALVVTPASQPRRQLAELLSRITPQNLHHELDTGAAAGNEAW